MRHRFGLIAAIFEELADVGEPFCDIARDLGGVFGWVERVGIERDRPQAFADMLVAQIFQIDAEAAAVGELDRKSVVWGKGGSVRVDLGGRGSIHKQTNVKL